MESSDRTCEWCGQSFTPQSTRGPKPRFCSASHRQRAYEARRGVRAHETVSESPISDAFKHLVDSGQVTEETLAPFTGALRQAITPLLEQQTALAAALSTAALASMPKIDLGEAMKPLLDQQSALAATLNASFAKIDMSPILKPLAEHQAALADAVGASTIAALAKLDMSSVLKPLLDAADSFASIPGLLSLDRDLTIRADQWFGGFDDDVQREARQLASSIADDVGLPLSDPAAPLLLATMLIAIILTWRVEIDLQAAAVGAVRSAVVTGQFAAEFAEQVDERLPQIQNLHLWLLILLHVFRSRHRSAGESSSDP